MQAGEQGCAGLRTELAQQRGRAQQMQAEPQSQAEQMTVLKLKQKSAEHEASNVQAPKVCLGLDCCHALSAKSVNQNPASSSSQGSGFLGSLPGGRALA